MPWEIPTKLWDKDKGRIKPSSSFPEGDFINGVIKKLEANLDDYKYDCHRNGITIDEVGIQKAINTVLAPKTENKLLYLSDVGAEVIEKSLSGERLRKDGNRISEATIKKYRIALWHLENFEEQYGDVPLNTLNKEFGRVLQTYFNDIGLAHNTKATHLVQYILFYNYAVENGWMEPTDFPKARIPEVETDSIALTQEEVDKLFHLNLSMYPELDEIRDVFLTGVWTLMRFGDYSDIKSYNIKDDHIKIITKKTTTPVYLPIHDQLKEILKKYNNKLPHAPSLQTFNKTVKEIAKRAGLTQLEEVKRYKGGKIQKHIVKRYELMGSHTARRTGATLLYLHRIPKKQIMLLTGHSKEVHFDRYVKIGRYANAKLLSKNEIFKSRTVLGSKENNINDGFYWVNKGASSYVAKISNAYIYYFEHAPISVDSFIKQGGEILKEIAPI